MSSIRYFKPNGRRATSEEVEEESRKFKSSLITRIMTILRIWSNRDQERKFNEYLKKKGYTIAKVGGSKA